MRTDLTPSEPSAVCDEVAHRPPPGTTQAAWTSIVALLVTATLWGELQGSTVLPAWVDVLLGAAACGLVVVMFHRPLTGAVLLALLAAVSPAATPPATLGTLYVARLYPFPVAVGVAVVGVLAHAGRALWRPVEGISLPWWLLLVVVAHAALVGWGALSRARHALIAALTDRARRAEAEQGRRVAEARAAERRRIAREMHDVLAHRLSLVATYAGALEYRPDASPQRLSQAAGVVRSGVHEALDELRDVITVLRDDDQEADRDGIDAGTPQPSLTDVPALVEESRAAGMHVDLDDRIEDPSRVPPTVGRTVYRVVQEALTNARKHAAGEPVALVLTGAPASGLVVEVSNPAPTLPATGGHPVPGSGTGLVGLTERARLADGTLDHEHAHGRFTLCARLPWPA